MSEPAGKYFALMDEALVFFAITFHPSLAFIPVGRELDVAQTKRTFDPLRAVYNDA